MFLSQLTQGKVTVLDKFEKSAFMYRDNVMRQPV
jgi:hypothetical protein